MLFRELKPDERTAPAGVGFWLEVRFMETPSQEWIDRARAVLRNISANRYPKETEAVISEALSAPQLQGGANEHMLGKQS